MNFTLFPHVLLNPHKFHFQFRDLFAPSSLRHIDCCTAFVAAAVVVVVLVFAREIQIQTEWNLSILMHFCCHCSFFFCPMQREKTHWLSHRIVWLLFHLLFTFSIFDSIRILKFEFQINHHRFDEITSKIHSLNGILGIIVESLHGISIYDKFKKKYIFDMNWMGMQLMDWYNLANLTCQNWKVLKWW